VPATAEPVAELPQPAAPAPQPLPVLGSLIPASALTTETPAVVTEQPAVAITPQPQVPTAAPVADAAPEPVAIPSANAGQTQSDAQPQEQPTPAAPAPAAAPQQAKPAEAPAGVSAPAPQPVAAPAAPVQAPTPTPTLERAVPLYRAVETTGLLLHVAAERGVTHARLNLKPVELGGIEVRLQSTPQGVSAQLVADSPEAARMLTQAGEDLRRQLADRDVNLLSLDVSTSSEQRHENTAGGFGAFGDDNYRPGFGSSQRANGPTTAEPAAPAPAETTLVLPDGVLVDVLA
jgi:flagellar hook-length control protein FliK